MKILGYIDDIITFWSNWQVSIGWWNLLLIPIEFWIIFEIYYMFRNWGAS